MVRLFAFSAVLIFTAASARSTPKKHRPERTEPDSKYPYAEQIPGRPGFLRPPFSPGGIIDARGFPRGTEIRDPYTREVFLVP